MKRIQPASCVLKPAGMGGRRSTPRPTRGASTTEDGRLLAVGAASALSSGAVAPARGGATTVVPSRISAGGGAASSPGVAKEDEEPATNSSNGAKHQRNSRATARPITHRNMARPRSAAKPDEWPVQNRATGGQLGLHRWGATETHPDRNHGHPRRKAEPANSSQEGVRKPHTRGECRQTEHAQPIIKAGLVRAAALQPLHEAEQ